jgi:hypothetical protein
MANQVFNVALRRAAEFFNRIDTNDPAASELVFFIVGPFIFGWSRLNALQPARNEGEHTMLVTENE